jgi:hypothetical protein
MIKSAPQSTLHTIVVGLVYAAIVITPCILALFTRLDDPDTADSNVLEDGFI